MPEQGRLWEAVYLSQPTVSAHIAALEQAVGTRPFDRLGIKQVFAQGQGARARDLFADVAARRNLSPPVRRFREFLHTQRS
jgi:DNA-binding transcriptional LysR family regulator